ncbi:Disease resistance protein [Nymphaea thermarum]|nr:Disease resistance protein [Nymphaea thermarum]
MACIPIPSDAICECLLGSLKWTFGHALRHACYLKNHQTNYETLIRENDMLRTIEEHVNKLVTAEDRKGRDIRREVEEWQKKTRELKNEAECIIRDFQEAQGTCTCCRGLPNCWYCYRRGKAAGRKHKEVAAHIEKAPMEAEQVSKPREINRAAPLNPKPLDGQETATRFVKEILDNIKDASISRIGVYGMGGVGKTTIVKHVHNQAKEFDFIMYIVVSQNLDYKHLQEKIAQYLELPLAKGADLSEGEKLILTRLKGWKYLLILDDVWQDLDIHVLGVPDPVNGSKVVVVSRTLDACHAMQTDKNIKVEAMCWKDAMSLFIQNTGDVIKQPTIEKIAMEVLRECGGLPIAITTIGAALRNNDDAAVWEDTLRALKQSTGETEGMDEKVFKILKLSYKFLDETKQNCFLYLSMFPEDEIIFTYFLSINWHLEGYIGDGMSIKEIVNKGREIILRLKNANLLESAGYAQNVNMHDLIRDLAVYVSSSEDEANFTKTGRGVSKAPTEEEWMKAKRISLMRTSIETLPDRPVSPQLKTLLFEGCEGIKTIPCSFFESMFALEILNLNGTMIKRLPDSLTKLKSLRALYFYGCKMLEDIAAIVDLPELQVLDLYLTGVKELPDGFVNLKKLRILRMGFTFKLCKIPPNLFSNMPLLEVLNMFRSYGLWKTDSEGRTSAGQSQGTLNLEDLADKENLSSVELTIKESGESIQRLMESKLVGRLEGLAIQCCGNFEGIDSSKAEDAERLKALMVQSCPELKKIIRGTDPKKVIFPDLRLLQLEELPMLERVYVEMEAHISFLKLEKLTIKGCKALKAIFTYELLKQLQNLVHFEVSNCPEVENVIDGQVGDEDEVFPKLTSFGIHNLQKLTTIYEGVLKLKALASVEVSKCPLLKKLPLDAQNCGKMRIVQGEKEWWEGLVWQEESTKAAFQKYLIIKPTDA